MTIAAGLGNRFPMQFISICQLRQINYTYSDLCCNPTAPCSEPQWPCPQDMPWNSELVSRSRHVDEPEHTCPPRNRGEQGSFGWLLLRQSAKLFLNSGGQSNGGVRSVEHGARSTEQGEGPDAETFFMDALDWRTWRWFAGNALEVTPTQAEDENDKDLESDSDPVLRSRRHKMSQDLANRKINC